MPFRPAALPAVAVSSVAMAAALTSAAVLWPAAASAGSGFGPYVDPPFATHCRVHHFADGQAPKLSAYPDDPLCVEYQKRDITADNGGAVKFLLAEPSRFAIALPKCQYWQQDHWRVQVDRSAQHIVQWDGSYWFDKGTGRAAAILRNFRFEGRPADPGEAATLVSKISPELADAMRTRGSAGSFGIPFDPRCKR